jgi:hypothetical protein
VRLANLNARWMPVVQSPRAHRKALSETSRGWSCNPAAPGSGNSAGRVVAVAAAGVDNLSVGLCVVLNANETRSFDKDSPDPAPGSASARNLFHPFSFSPIGN